MWLLLPWLTGCGTASTPSDLETAGECTDTCTDGDTSHTSGVSLDVPPDSTGSPDSGSQCIEIDWAWSQGIGPTIAAVPVGDGGAALNHNDDGSYELFGFDQTKLAWGPVATDGRRLVGGTDRLVVLLPDPPTASLQVWTRDGQALAPYALEADVELRAASISTDGAVAIVGAKGGATGRERWVALLEPEGNLSWENSDPSVSEAVGVAFDDVGDLLLLSERLEIEGGCVLLERIDRSGVLSGRTQLACAGGFGDERVARDAFALASDGAGGVVTMGENGEGHLVVARYDAADALVWATVDPREPAGSLPVGQVARVGAWYAAAIPLALEGASRIQIYGPDGQLRCERALTQEQEMYPMPRMGVVGDLTIVVAGLLGEGKTVAPGIVQYRLRPEYFTP